MTNLHIPRSKDVITSLEFERLMNAAGPTGGTLLRPSDGKHPHTIVFVQCVGSRCDEQGQELLLQDLLYVHRKARNAHP